MTYAEYQQYKALLAQSLSLDDIELFICNKIPTQLGAKEYDYNQALTASMRRDFIRIIKKHREILKITMEQL